MALQENLPYRLNNEFRGYLVNNFKTLNQDRQFLIDKVQEHEQKKQTTKEIEHNNQLLSNVLNILNGRINNQIYGASKNSSAEVKDIRVDMEGSAHDIAQDRLNQDFSKIGATATRADDTSQKHEEQIEESAYYQEIDYVSGRKYDTSYKIVYIPHKDSDGNLIKLKKGLAGRPNQIEPQTTRNFASEVGATFASNASTGSTTNKKLHGQQIYEGQILDSIKSDEYDEIGKRWTLAIDDENNMTAFEPHITAKEIKDKGYNTTFSGFGPLIMGGKPVYKEGDYSDNSEQLNPRTAIAQLPNKDILIFSCDGRVKSQGLYQRGMKLGEVIDTLYDHYGEIEFAYNLDGGGSTSSVLRSKMLNKPTDNSNKSERKVLDFIYFGKDQLQPRDVDIQNAYKDIGEVRSFTQFLYGLIGILNTFESNELRMTRYNDYTGLVAMDGDEPKKKFYMEPGGFRFWDYGTGSTWFRVTEDDMQLHNRLLSKNFSAPDTVNNCNNLNTGGTYVVPKTATGSPYKNESSSVITQYNVTYADLDDATTAFQTAVPFARSTNYKMKRRSYSNGKWSDWFEV
ncbi:MAG: phosphodiester glycosidase family protein [Tetragenococcus sp.]|nr:phosphodiester glycosidase family protein [Tetragenococcus sp.]